MKKLLLAGFALASVMIIESCEPSSVTVSTRPASPYYSRPISPGPGYVWIDGDWRIRNHRYYWREGHWQRPGTRIWISGSWESRNGGLVLETGTLAINKFYPALCGIFYVPNILSNKIFAIL